MAYMPTRVGDESHTAGSDRMPNSSQTIPLHFSRSPQEIGGAAKKRLCSSCRETLPQNWFKSLPTKGPVTLKVGQLPHAREKQESCPFCRFLVEVYELAGIQPAADGNERETVYFVRESSDGPWYQVASIKAKLPLVPAVWLVYGHPHDAEQREMIRKPQDPYICISCMPNAASGKVQKARKYAYPRQRRWEKASKGYVDYDLIRSWLQVCQARHSYLCGKAMVFERQVLKLKLIDVSERVVKAAQDCDEYVALSYVWGEGSHRKISDELRHAICTGTTLPALPNTIEDAMIVVKQLGKDYLWVDWCCIDQDDEEDKKIQIQTMDLVYECSFCTIVAVDGVHADAGLSGVSRSLQQWCQPVVDLQDCCLMATNIDPVSDNHGRSPWTFRAWTLQEGILPRRCIFFDKKHTSMRCRQESFHDTMEVDLGKDRVPTLQHNEYFWENGFGLDLYSQQWDFLNFDILVANYTRRKLTNKDDALNACTGALNKMTTSTGVGFLWGMPVVDLSRALLWKSHHQACLLRRPGFPSWSWAGWEGRIEYHSCLVNWDRYVNQEEGNVFQKADMFSLRGDRAFIQPNTRTDNPPGQGLKVSSTMARFKLKKIRTQEPLKNHSDREEVAISDQWALFDRLDKPLINVVGDWPENFERTKHSFRTNPEISKVLKTAADGVECLFVRYWPGLRDSMDSKGQGYDMVGALVVLRNADGSYWRVAAVFIEPKTWLAADPQPAVVNLC